MVTGGTGGIAEGLKNCFSLCTLKDFLLYMVFSKKIKEVRFLGSIMIHPPMHYFIYDLSPYSVLSLIIQDNKTTRQHFPNTNGVFNFNMGNVAKRPPFDTRESDSE